MEHAAKYGVFVQVQHSEMHIFVMLFSEGGENKMKGGRVLVSLLTV